MVAMARAMAQDTPVYLLDEPTAHLDMGNRARIRGVLRHMAETGRAVLFSAHDPNEASLVADRVVILAGGGVAASGTPREVIREEILTRVYGTALGVVELRGRPMVVPLPG